MLAVRGAPEKYAERKSSNEPYVRKANSSVGSAQTIANIVAARRLPAGLALVTGSASGTGFCRGLKLIRALAGPALT
jgi:hypothetical protein